MTPSDKSASTQPSRRQKKFVFTYARTVRLYIYGTHTFRPPAKYTAHACVPGLAPAGIVARAQDARQVLERAGLKLPIPDRVDENAICVQAQGAWTGIGKPTTVIEKGGYASP